MNNLRGLLDIRRMDRVLSAQIRVLCGVKKGVNEGLDKSVLQWFSHIERMGNDTIAKRGVYAGSCLVRLP